MKDLREVILNVVHDLVTSEIERVDEEAKGLVRRDGGRQMAEVYACNKIFDEIRKYVGHVDTCHHEWADCPSTICTSDLHNVHCKKCGKHGMIMPKP